MSVPALTGAMGRLALQAFPALPSDHEAAVDPLATDGETSSVDALPSRSPPLVDLTIFPTHHSLSSSRTVSPCPTSCGSSLSVYDCLVPPKKGTDSLTEKHPYPQDKCATRRNVLTLEGIVIRSFLTSNMAAHVAPNGRLYLKTSPSIVAVQDFSQKQDISEGYPSQSLHTDSPGLPALRERPLLETLVSEDGTVLAEHRDGRYQCIYSQVIDPIVAACYGNGKFYCLTDQRQVFEIADERPEQPRIITLPAPYSIIRDMKLVSYVPPYETFSHNGPQATHWDRGGPVTRLIVVASGHIASIPCDAPMSFP